MPLKRHYRKASPLTARLKRGDTVIEVMFALSVFCLVAVISIAMMNLGVAQAENALEIVVTRNELNAQAEALRFIHSSFISEKTLPTYSELTPTQRADGEKYQQYADLWHEIVRNAIAPNEAAEITDLENTIFTPSETTGVVGCDRLYDGGDNSILSRKKAFVYTLVSGLAETVGAIVGMAFLFPFWTPEINAYCLAAVAGVMVYISFDELLPGAERYGHHHIALGGVIAGMAIMALTLLIL